MKKLKNSILDNIESTKSIINESRKITSRSKEKNEAIKSCLLGQEMKRINFVDKTPKNHKFNYHKAVKKNKHTSASKNTDFK